jgi:hypothetical protein
MKYETPKLTTLTPTAINVIQVKPGDEQIDHVTDEPLKDALGVYSDWE